MSNRGAFGLLVISWVLLCLGPASADGLWVKGNTHAHSTLSDGNVPPEQVAQWFREHGYGFVFLTDHNTLAPLDFFAAHSDAAFLILPGEELSDGGPEGIFAVHTNALGIAEPLKAAQADTVEGRLLGDAEVVRRAGAVLQANHPSFYARDPQAVAKVPDPFLIEVYNHSVGLSPYGKLAQVLFEKAWDAALTAGKKAFGVASDDCHDYSGRPDSRSSPGGGWIMVRVAALTAEEVLRSLAAGQFYSSTGVELDEISFDGATLRLRIRPQPEVTYTTHFIGMEGKVLASVEGSSPQYTLTGAPEETYVRARVEASNGAQAWTQPIWPARGD